MHTGFQRFCSHTIGVAILAAAGSLLTAAPASAQSAETLYQRALTRETAARKAAAPSVTTLRSIAVNYENIVRRFPRSGYADNALWQGAGVLQLAWERAGNRRDREQAIKLLQWLRKEYPSATLARQVTRQVAEINKPRVPPTRHAAAPPRGAPSATATTTAAASTSPTTTAPATVVSTASMSGATAASPPPGVAAASARSAATPEPSGAPVHLRGISHTTLPRGDRITLELSREPIYSAERDEAAGKLTVALTGADAASAIANAASSIRGSLIQALRVERDGTNVQMVITLNGQPRHSAFPLYDPYRLVFDFESAPEATSTTAGVIDTTSQGTGTAPRPFPQSIPVVAKSARATGEPSAHVPAASAAAPLLSTAVSTVAAAVPSGPASIRERDTASPATPPDDADATEDDDADESEVPASTTKPAPPASTSAGGYSLARQLGLGVSRIVIDPGHGGTDPGAQANGVTESALVLDVALRLEKLLKAQPGFEVVLTRRTNQAVPLARRTAIANDESADLFLSIHANSSPRRETAGVETYFLNFASNDHAESVAARENASSAQAMRLLPQLVRAIAMNNKLAESRELATMVQSSLVRRLRPRNKLFQDLGVKQAPFVVLIGAQMPSVLAEIAFLTNRTESSLLKQNAYKQQVAQALCDSILRYQASLKKVSTVTASAEAP